MKLLILIMTFLLMMPSAEATTGWKHIVKKTLLFPVYVVFAQPIAIIAWWETADQGIFSKKKETK